eukprot:6191884-Pleurochrysis_carterae.AAC.1
MASKSNVTHVECVQDLAWVKATFRPRLELPHNGEKLCRSPASGMKPRCAEYVALCHRAGESASF